VLALFGHARGSGRAINLECDFPSETTIGLRRCKTATDGNKSHETCLFRYASS